MKSVKVLLVALVVSLLLNSCAWYEKQSSTTKAGTVGAAAGGLAGILIDSSNPWRGGVIGAAIGAVSGALIGNIIEHSTQESARNNAHVRYSRTTEKGIKEDVEAQPKGREGSYKLISVKYVRDGKVVGEEIKKVPLK